jgi:hypothetical protein
MKKIYISGKISGLPENEVKEKFDKAEREMLERGYEVVNPLKKAIPYSASWQIHIAIDIILLMGCDAIYLLSDWIYSRGASLEQKIAETTGKEIIYQQTPYYLTLKQIIENVTGVTFYSIAGKKRDRKNVYIRMIYAYFAHSQGAAIEKIANELHRNHSTVIYYLRKYSDEKIYNHTFSEIVKQIETAMCRTETPQISTTGREAGKLSTNEQNNA